MLLSVISTSVVEKLAGDATALKVVTVFGDSGDAFMPSIGRTPGFRGGGRGLRPVNSDTLDVLGFIVATTCGILVVLVIVVVGFAVDAAPAPVSLSAVVDVGGGIVNENACTAVLRSLFSPVIPIIME